MGRWTVAEWLAQAQEHSPLPGGEDDLEYGDGMYPHYHETLLEEDGEFEDEDDYGKPLPACPGPLPPTPPTKIASAQSFSVVAGSLVDRSGNSLFASAKESRRTRGKRGKTDTSVHAESKKPERSTEADSDYNYLRCQPEILVPTPAEFMPRSPDPHRPREFFVRSNVKRAPPKSKSKLKTAFGRDEYTFKGQALQILVSTQVTETQSAHDAGRPRVFYPRSSSLPSAPNNVLPCPPNEIIMPTPSRSSRALPAVPVVSAINALTNRSLNSAVASSGPRQIRPLPVPRPPP
ncbi:hypothetical protein K438DRAFT_1982574 [Mycena galopus ATCC 62051]|nr:hypothetical protein K438DRAFT_1982574 [Mycena galopus ATCC 62051]